MCQSDTSVLTLLGSPTRSAQRDTISWLPPEPEIARLTLAPAVKTKKSKKTRCMMGTLMEHLGHVEGEEMPPNQETRTTKRGQQKISKHAHPDPLPAYKPCPRSGSVFLLDHSATLQAPHLDLETSELGLGSLSESTKLLCTALCDTEPAESAFTSSASEKRGRTWKN